MEISIVKVRVQCFEITDFLVNKNITFTYNEIYIYINNCSLYLQCDYVVFIFNVITGK